MLQVAPCGGCYQEDLAYVQAAGYGALAAAAAGHLLERMAGLSVPVRRILDVGCGAGITTALFSAKGYCVLGIEPSSHLAASARQRAPRAQVLEASAYEVEPPPCEAIVAVGEVLGYHPEPARARALVAGFLAKAAAALPAGGLLAFDVIATGKPSLAGRSWSAGPDWAVLVEVKDEPEERRLLREIEVFRAPDGKSYRRSREVHSVYLFAPDELHRQLAELGFEVELATAYGNHALAPRRLAVFAIRKP